MNCRRIGLAGAIVCGLVALPALGAAPGIDRFTFFGYLPGDYRVTVNRTDAAKPWLEIAAHRPRPDEFGAIAWTFDVAPWRTKRIRITAQIQTVGDVLEGTLWAKVEGRQTIAFDGPTESTTDAVAPYRQLHGAHGWTEAFIVVDVPADATAIQAGVLLQGSRGAVRTTLPALTAVGEDVAVTASQIAASTVPASTIEPIDAARRVALVDDVRHALKPIASADPAARDDDTKAILDAIGPARIAGLGEATHGTSEFFNLKDRMFRDLVRKRGFTVFAIEAAQPEAREMDRYVVTGAGDPRRALKSLQFWTWQTQEVLALARWMRSYNASRGNRPALHFAGFDMQSATVAAETVVTAVRKADAAAGKRVASAIACVRKPESVLTTMSDAAWSACRASIAAIAPVVSRYVSDVDARHDLQILQQFAAWGNPRNTENARGMAMRDKDMADNVSWLADVRYPGQKIMLWAHNAHIANEDALVPTMGSTLAKRFGTSYYRLGFAFSGGSFRAWDGARNFRPVAVGSAPPDTFDGVLHSAGTGIFFLDLDNMAPSTLSAWLSAPVWHRDVGGLYVSKQEGSNFALVPLRKEYDGLIFVDRSHPSRYLGFKS
jgi:erythromycin esterase